MMNQAPLPAAVQTIVDDLFERYASLLPARDGLIDAFWAISEAFNHGGILYLCGNGGSFADAMHIKGELAKKFMIARSMTEQDIVAKLNETELGRHLAKTLETGFPVVVLGESHSIRSAFENDRDPVLNYAQELYSFINTVKPGVFLGISTSGNAKNVLAAATLANAYGLESISFTGPEGGELAKLSSIPWRVPGESTPVVQEHQLPLYHALCKMLEANIFSA